MANIQVKVTMEPVKVTVNKEDYADAWQEYQEENGDLDEGESAGEPSDEFVLERFQESLENGDEDLTIVFESASIDVTKA